MSKVTKITEEELKSIKASQEKIFNILAQIGSAEAQKQGLLFHQNEAQKELENIKSALQEEYGDINIDMKDGSFTLFEKQEEETAELKPV